MTKTKSLGLEPQFLCDVCSIAVTNPLCPACLTQEIEAWSTLYPNIRNELLPKLNKYLGKVEDRVFDSTKCIKCQNKRASVCPYCFTAKVFGDLKKMNANRTVLKEFVEFFNFDFEHTEYSQEAERLGVI
ncbi:Uncharacterised protein [uncultured archaeon]|nr:Uncharacterised protein [uncultured archaeon]